MKKIFFLLILASWQLFADSSPEFFGFSKILFSENNLSLDKTRLGVKGSLENDRNWVNFGYNIYFDYNSQGQLAVGFTETFFSFNKDWLPKVILGKTLNPLAYQFPAPHKLPFLRYPNSYLCSSYVTGFFLREDYKGLWLMTGLANGTGDFQDDNQNLDFTGRLTYQLPYSFKVGAGCQSGQQPCGYREISGFDLAWQKGFFKAHIGQNSYSFCKTNKTCQWVMLTVDITSWLQLAGYGENLEIAGDNSTGFSWAVNISPSEKTVFRLGHYQLASEKSSSWGMLYQIIF